MSVIILFGTKSVLTLMRHRSSGFSSAADLACYKRLSLIVLLFCLLAFRQDCVAPACVNVCGCDVVDAPLVSMMVVLANEGNDVRFETTRQEVVFQQDAVLESRMPCLNLAVCLRTLGCTSNACQVIDDEVHRVCASCLWH